MADRTVNAVRNVRWEDYAQTMIYMEVDFDELDEVYVPFTASMSDPEPYGRTLYQNAIDGDYGPIGPYQAPDDITGDDAMGALRMERNSLLDQTDYIEMPTKWASLTSDQQAAWTAYRNALRNLPANTSNLVYSYSPQNEEWVWSGVTWPTEPS